MDSDCTSAVICGDTALLCHLNRGDASSSTALLLRGNKRVQEPNCKKEFEWERRSSLLNSTQGVLGRMSYGKSARGKHLPLLEGRGEGGERVLADSSLCLSRGLRPQDSSSSHWAQTEIRACCLTSEVLSPALLLAKIFQSPVNLLSSAPCEELSQHRSLPKCCPRRGSTAASSTPCSGAVTQQGHARVFVHPTSGKLKNGCIVILKLCFLKSFLEQIAMVSLVFVNAANYWRKF